MLKNLTAVALVFAMSAMVQAGGGRRCNCCNYGCCATAAQADQAGDHIGVAPKTDSTAQADAGTRTYSVEPAPAPVRHYYYAPTRAYRVPVDSYLIPKSSAARFSVH